MKNYWLIPVFGVVIFVIFQYITSPEPPESDLYLIENVESVEYLNSTDYYIHAIVKTKSKTDSTSFTERSVYVKVPFERHGANLVCYTDTAIEDHLQSKHDDTFKIISICVLMFFNFLVYGMSDVLVYFAKKNEKKDGE